MAISYNEEREFLASGGRDSVIKVWNAHALCPTQRGKRADDKGFNVHLEGNMDGQRGDICSIVWLSNGAMLIAGSRDNSIQMYDALELTPIRGIKADVSLALHISLQLCWQ